MPYRVYVSARAICLAVALLIGSAATLGFLTDVTSAVEFGKREPLSIITASGKTDFQVEIANTDAQREEGLMFRPSLPDDEGMLFDFKTPQRVYFWMKNTYVPLDMIFIYSDGMVARVAENTTPLSENTVPSEKEVRFVLEVKAGIAARIGLKVGDKVVNRLMK